MHTKVNESTFAGQPIYVGIDVHLRSWKVTVMAGDVYCKTFSAPPEADKLANYLKENFPGGNYYSAYEAGFCGFSASPGFCEPRVGGSYNDRVPVDRRDLAMNYLGHEHAPRLGEMAHEC